MIGVENSQAGRAQSSRRRKRPKSVYAELGIMNYIPGCGLCRVGNQTCELLECFFYMQGIGRGIGGASPLKLQLSVTGD